MCAEPHEIWTSRILKQPLEVCGSADVPLPGGENKTMVGLAERPADFSGSVGRSIVGDSDQKVSVGLGLDRHQGFKYKALLIECRNADHDRAVLERGLPGRILI